MAAGKEHRYTVEVSWTGNTGEGTAGYKAYERSYDIKAESKAAIAGSSDPAFRGDPARWNPEELLVASLSACHKLWYLHLCAVNGITVIAYTDRAEGVMAEDADGEGAFKEVVLRPEVTLAADSDVETARGLHKQARDKCFIANSVNFPVHHEPVVHVAVPGSSSGL